MVPFFSMKNAAGSRITSVLIDFGSDARTFPERRGLGLPDLLDHQRLELRHRLERQLEIGQRDRGILADDPEHLQLAGERVLEHRHGAVVLGGVALGQPLVAVVVLGGGGVSEKCLERVDEVAAVGDAVLAHVVVDRRLGIGRRVEVARVVVVEHRHVARALHVRLAAQRVDAAAGLADVAEQQLQDRERPDPLHAGRVLGHAERVEDGARPVLRHRLGDLLDLIGRNAGDLLAHLQRVARDEGLQAREHAVRVVEALGDARIALRVELVSPGLGVVGVVASS